MEENLKLSGQLAIVLTDANGQVKDTRNVNNLVVNSGLAYVISRMVGPAKDAMSHMQLGKSTTAAAAGQTGLLDALTPRKAFSSSAVISGTNNEKVTYTASFGAGEATGAVTEAGIFNAATNGDMLARVKFDVINKGADDTLAISWTITLSAV